MLVAVTGDAPELSGRARRLRAFTYLGRMARHFELPLVVTTPAMFRLSRRRFLGWAFRGSETTGAFVWGQSRLPRQVVVYDAMYLADLKRFRILHHALHSDLVRHKIPFFNPPMSTKDAIYQTISNAGGRDWLPRTWYHVSPERVLQLLDEGRNLWLKPTIGSGGRNMFYVARKGDRRYQVEAERFFGKRVHEEFEAARLRRLLLQAMRRRSFMAQENIPLRRTKDGRRFDTRVHVQRDETGRWGVVAITGRLGRSNSRLTNFHAGGRVLSLTEPTPAARSLLTELGLGRTDLENASQLGIKVAERLQGRYPSLGILGLDIGTAEDGKQFVYDFNGRPGRDILTDAEVEHSMRSTAGFARYLLDARSKRPG